MVPFLTVLDQLGVSSILGPEYVLLFGLSGAGHLVHSMYLESSCGTTKAALCDAWVTMWCWGLNWSQPRTRHGH